jgi:hypothetical protein
MVLIVQQFNCSVQNTWAKIQFSKEFFICISIQRVLGLILVTAEVRLLCEPGYVTLYEGNLIEEKFCASMFAFPTCMNTEYAENRI